MDYRTLVSSTLARWHGDAVAFVTENFGVEPYPWQVDALRRIAKPDVHRLAMKASKGPGKLQPKDMMLYTPDGLRRWGDVVAGDQLFAEDGSPTTVIAVHDNGVVPLYRVYFDDGSSTLAGADHLWKVRGAAERVRKCRIPYRRETRTGDVWSVLTTQQIIERGVRNSNGRWQGRQFEIPRHGPVQFPHRALPLDPYVLGVWLGDGGRRSGRFTGADEHIDQEIVRRGYRLGPKDEHTCQIYGICVALRRLELFELGSPDRYVPELYRTASIQQRLDVLRGLMDTDGCIGDDGHCEFAVTSQRLADDVVHLVRSLGGVAFQKESIKQGWYPAEDGARIQCRDAYRVTVVMPVCPFLTPRKASRWTPKDTPARARYLKRYIDRIEPAGEGDAMCVEIDHPSRCYLANDFIVTHNTAVLAWIILWFLTTRHEAKVGATSITENNIDGNLWPELSKWLSRSSFLSGQFAWSRTRVSRKADPSKWFAEKRTWPKSGDTQAQADALAGLHADNVMFVLDESGGIPQGVMVTAEAVLANLGPGNDAKVLQAGNPTHTTGPLYRACTQDRHLWEILTITGDPDNPKRSPNISIEWAREQIASYGRTNPWVMVNVLGEFPPSSINALLGIEDVETAMRRHLPQDKYSWAQRRIGVDVARFGDDRTVLFARQGFMSWAPIEMRGADTIQIVSRVAHNVERWSAELVCVDNSFHWGNGVVDLLMHQGSPVMPVNFADPGTTPRFKNIRSEMWMKLAEWVKAGGQLPAACPALVAELIEPTYTFLGGQFLLEPKDEIKKRLGYSPDLADALALTFCIADMPADMGARMGVPQLTRKHAHALSDGDPFGTPTRDAPVAHDGEPWT